MRIIVIGGTGTIGSAVVSELSRQNEVISIGHIHGNFQLDITDTNSIDKQLKSIGKFDALISTTGKVHFAPLSEMTEENYVVGLKDKLMGQVNLVLIGLRYINDGGSFTLTSGILATDPIRTGSSASMVNSAINGFVIGSAIEMPRNIRINAVSPTVVTESMPKFGTMFSGYVPVDAKTVALAYSKSVNGAQTGKIFRVGY